MAQKTQDSITIEDFTGVNQQVDRENIGNFDSWQTQNMWEKKINVLETRGHSNTFSAAYPSNISALDDCCRIFKNTLDHKRIVAARGSETTPGTWTLSLPGTVVPSFVSGGNWNLDSPNTNLRFGANSIYLRFFGYGYDKQVSLGLVTGISGYSYGSGQKFQIVVNGAMPNSNITGIEVYANVDIGGTTNTAGGGYIWVGTIDLIATPTGTFTFANAPLSKKSNNASGSVGTAGVQFTLTGANVNGGTLVPGRRYYVMVMPHLIIWANGSTANDCQWYQPSFNYNTAPSIVLSHGQNSINVNYPANTITPQPPTFNSMLICIGEHPQLLIPQQLTNIYTNTSGGALLGTISAFPQNTPAVVDIEYTDVGICNFRFRQSDFSTNDTLTRVNNDGSIVPVFIARQTTVNRYSNGLAGSPTAAFSVTASSDGGSPAKLVITTSGLPSSDPFPTNTAVVFSFIGGGSMPGGLTDGNTVYLISLGSGAYNVSNTVNGSAIAYTSAGASVTMFAVPLFTSYLVNSLFTGGYMIAQPLQNQSYCFTQWNNLALFVTGPLNGIASTGVTPGGYIGTPVNGTNYYVTDGNVAAGVVFDFSYNPVPIPQATICTTYNESIVVGGGQMPSLINQNATAYCDSFSWSGPNNPFNFEVAAKPGVNNFLALQNGGEYITGFGVFPYTMIYASPQSFLSIHKLNSTWILNALPSASNISSTFCIDINKNIGTTNIRTIQATPIGLIFAYKENVYMFKSSSEIIPIGDPISWILKKSDLSRACGVYHDEQYKLSFYCSDYSGSSSYNNVEFWLDIKKMKQNEGKPDWKGPMIGRQIDFNEIEQLTGDGVVQNLTRDRVCVDRQNIRAFKADVLPAPTDTAILDFGAAVTSLLETKDYRVKESDNDKNKLFDVTLWKVRTNKVSGAPLSATVNTFIEGVSTDTQTVTFAGLAATNFDDQPQVYKMEFPGQRNRGRTVRKKFSTTSRVGICGFQLFYKVEKRKLGT